MEVCKGGELFERLAKRKFYTEVDAAKVTEQMVAAVSYLHANNICHRDLKLENWLYESDDPDAALMLCDFGFGQVVEPSAQLHGTMGSLYYIAPEVLEGSVYGLPCDIWSLGVIVFMMISGTPPFVGDSDWETTELVKRAKYSLKGPRWTDISEKAKHFVHSLLRKDPNDRLTASEAQEHSWLNWKKARDTKAPVNIDTKVLREISGFAATNTITRTALGLLAHQSFSGVAGEEDLKTLEDEFKKLDVSGKGLIQIDDFTQVLKSTLNITDDQASSMFGRMIGAVQPKKDEELEGLGVVGKADFAREYKTIS